MIVTKTRNLINTWKWWKKITNNDENKGKKVTEIKANMKRQEYNQKQREDKDLKKKEIDITKMKKNRRWGSQKIKR